MSGIDTAYNKIITEGIAKERARFEEVRKVLEELPPIHLYCARREDMQTLCSGLLHDDRQRFYPEDALPSNANDGYGPPLVLDVHGQRLYIYPPR